MSTNGNLSPDLAIGGSGVCGPYGLGVWALSHARQGHKPLRRVRLQVHRMSIGWPKPS